MVSPYFKINYSLLRLVQVVRFSVGQATNSTEPNVVDSRNCPNIG